MFPSLAFYKAARPAVKIIAVVGFCLLLTLLSVPRRTRAIEIPVPPSGKAKPSRAEFMPGEIIVRFRAGAEPVQRKASRFQLRLPSVKANREIVATVERMEAADAVVGLRLARVAPEDTLAAIDELNDRPDVLYAEPNFIRRKYALPDDPRFSEMWGLKNTGQPSSNGTPGQPGADIKAEAAWDITTGSRSIVVGVIDEGIDINHPDLRDNIWHNPGEINGNGIDDDGNGYVDDVNGWDFFHNDASVYDGSSGDNETDAHGTHVAGTIGATGNNATGVVGVNWQTSLMSLKILGRDGESSAPASVLKTVQAYAYAKRMRELWESSGGTRGANVRVLNNSYGGGGFSQAELDAIRALGDVGILFVASAGNDNKDNDREGDYPSGYAASNIISVAASDRGDFLAQFSNYGANSVHVAAPGVGILSTTPGGTYSFFSGTSMASPHVAGIAALISASFPSLSVRRLRAAVMYSGDKPDSLSNNLRPVSTGRRVNAFKALQNLSTDNIAPAAINDLRFAIDPHIPSRNVNLSWTAPGGDGNTGQAAAYEVRYSDVEFSTVEQFERALTLKVDHPQPAGSSQQATVTIPYRHYAGYIGIRAVDGAGNFGAITSTRVVIDQALGDPYEMSASAPEPLSTGGTPLGLIGDDKYKTYTLPFRVQFFETIAINADSSVFVSINGALYFRSSPPTRPNGDADDAGSSISGLTNRKMIAGLWDDLRTDRRAGDDVYIVTPDPDRVIFRWQGVTYDTPLSRSASRGEHPVNFEIEVRRDGTIIKRYGDGNTNIFPVVGISGGAPDPYVVESHTSESSYKSLTFAPTVTYRPRLMAPPSANLQLRMSSNLARINAGEQVKFDIEVSNLGTHRAPNTVVTNSLPSSTSFVSCVTNVGTCSAPTPGSTNKQVTINLEDLASNGVARISITAQVSAYSSGTISNTATVTSIQSDPDLTNNSATSTVEAIAQQIEPATLTADQVEIRGWRIGVFGSNSAYVRLQFPHEGYRVVEWKPVVYGGTELIMDVEVGRSLQLPARQIPYSTARIFDLGALMSNEYSVTVRTSGAIAKSQRIVFNNAPITNPVDDAREFARQQYLDFLSREPDAPGWDHWTVEITECSDASRRRNGETEAQCIDRKRANTSGAFFLSLEHQATGYYVYRMYKGALGRQPYLSEFTPDARAVAQGIVVSNALSAEVINSNKAAFARNFVQRPEFKSKYDGLTDEQYLVLLFETTGVMPNGDERQALLSELTGGAGTRDERRASVLQKVVDGQQAQLNSQNGVEQVFTNAYGRLFYEREFNRAFVLMQYFGYLRRDPDAEGYQHWLGKLNQFGNFVDAEMVRAFIVSAEYRSRFGQP